MTALKRIHLANVNMTYEQAVCLVEILPDVIELASIRLSGNTALVRLADAQGERDQEEACALYAALLTATKLSGSIVSVEIEVPSERSSEVVKAMAKQVVAYCLRNMESRLPLAGGVDSGIGSGATASNSTPALTATTTRTTTTAAAAATTTTTTTASRIANVMYDLVDLDETDDANEPDDAYMIGGTGVAKALDCVLNNSRDAGSDSRRPSVDAERPTSSALAASKPNARTASPLLATRPRIAPCKAKELSRQLLASARKIRTRIQPSLAKLAGDPDADQNHYRRLEFLDQTLQSIIDRFEDEYPETRLAASAADHGTTSTKQDPSRLALPPSEDEDEWDDEDDVPTGLASPSDAEPMIRPLSRTSSSLSLSQTSRLHGVEEGLILRAGHRLRQNISATTTLAPPAPQKTAAQRYDLLLSGIDLASNPRHAAMLDDILDDIGLGSLRTEKGAAAAFEENRDEIVAGMKRVDPEHWRLFEESQEMARKNVEPC